MYSPPPGGGVKWQIQAQFFFYFQVFLWIYIQIFPIAIPCPPQSTKSTLAPSRPETNERFTPLIIPAETILSLFQLDTQMFRFFQRIGEMVQNIFTNALRKIFVKGSMHLIYERNLILFNNPLFQAIDARTN